MALPNSSLVHRIVQELGPDLARVARRARALGPTHEGTAVLVTGCRHGVGCTTVALALAQAAAAEQAVLLIDTDLTQPSLSRQLGITPACGWEDGLDNAFRLDEALLGLSGTPRLTLLPLRQPAADPAKLRTHPAFSRWQHRFRGAYDLIVLDGGSVWNGGADWAAWVDVALVVCDSGTLWAADGARAWDKVTESGTPVLGIIET